MLMEETRCPAPVAHPKMVTDASHASFNSLAPGITTAKPIGMVERARRLYGPRHRSVVRSGGELYARIRLWLIGTKEKILEDSWQKSCQQ